jgi:hypothetical protein
MIVSGRADARREQRAEAKEAKTGNRVSARAETPEPLLTCEEYVHEISKVAFAKLKPVWRLNWELYRKVCEELSNQFAEACKTSPLAKAIAGGAD